jgi:hypothetical protein
MTAVFDYGPLPSSKGGFQVVYSSRQTNSAGDVKEIYRSNAGSLDLDKNLITGEGGLEEQYAKEMGMQAHQLGKHALLSDGQATETAANTGVDQATSAHMRNWMECVRSRNKPNANIDAGYQHSVALCMTIAAIQTGQRVSFDDARQEVVTGASV